MKKKKIIFVVGPTASGKSELSYKLARKHSAALVNCDSLQVYTELNIGSAKPSPCELAPYPHYLFNCAKINENITAGIYRKKALEVLHTTNHSTYIFVGGSGFYIKALVQGMFEEVPIKSEAQNLVNELKQQKTKLEFFHELEKRDPEYARKIHYNDQYRVGRALELILSLNKSMSQINEEFSKKAVPFPFPHLFLGLEVDRTLLRQRVALRLEKMLEQGFRQEVEQLLDEAQSDWKPLSSVGYKEMRSLISGQITEDAFKEEVVKNTMRLAKRQMTWFRANKDIHWLNAQAKDLGLIDDLCNDFLNPT